MVPEFLTKAAERLVKIWHRHIEFNEIYQKRNDRSECAVSEVHWIHYTWTPGQGICYFGDWHMTQVDWLRPLTGRNTRTRQLDWLLDKTTQSWRVFLESLSTIVTYNGMDSTISSVKMQGRKVCFMHPSWKTYANTCHDCLTRPAGWPGTMSYHNSMLM